MSVKFMEVENTWIKVLTGLKILKLSSRSLSVHPASGWFAMRGMKNSCAFAKKKFNWYFLNVTVLV